MPSSLPDLEAERSKIPGHFSTLGDLRPAWVEVPLRLVLRLLDSRNP